MNAPAFGVYIHWPYCAAICPYCDFNVRRDRGDDHSALIDAIAADIAEHGRRFSAGPARSVFFGGGTPSRLSGAQVDKMLRAVDAAFGLAADAEVSLEANPEDCARFAEHAAAGVNRFSLGVQALEDAALRALGRFHSARDALWAIDAAAHLGARVSADLIYAREGQTLDTWRAELVRALALPVEHLSLYQLTIEAGTPFARAVDRGRMAPPDADQAASLYAATQALCDDAGMPAYEISNHARSAAAQSRHNLLYWRGQAWAGVGPGAHGRLTDGETRLATSAHRGVRAYIDAVSANGVGWVERETLSAQAFADERLLMGLRLGEGVARRPIETLRGAAFEETVMTRLRDLGLLSFDATTLRLTPAGRLVCDRVIAELSRLAS
ncbi:MAG: radical SAM family heme chaperone HemW [Alphaproteobacteria bacterium]|nr:radical SAM family heme chaperone HemW [Alphaproteobacteria bacterium]